jgi:hypothetical protein
MNVVIRTRGEIVLAGFDMDLEVGPSIMGRIMLVGRTEGGSQVQVSFTASEVEAIIAAARQDPARITAEKLLAERDKPT